MEDEPVEQEPSGTRQSFYYQITPHSSPLPFVDSDYEKKVDEDAETHSDDHSRYLQPTECKVKPMFPWVVSYMYSSWVRR